MNRIKTASHIFLGLCIFLSCVLSSPAVSARDIGVMIDNKTLVFTASKPYADEANRTQIPLRAVSEGLGYGVIWVQESNSVYVFEVRENGTKIKCLNFVIGSNMVYILEAYGNNFSSSDTLSELEAKITSAEDIVNFEMDTTAHVINGRTYIPVRYIAELLDKSVIWDQTSYVVKITSQ